MVGLVGPRRVGPFVIEREIGRGGMGVVYYAVQVGLNRPVALKVLADDLAGSAEFVERFQREAAVLASVDSPHIIVIHDHGTADGVLYLATQYVTGGDLRQYLVERGPLPVVVALDVFAQVLEGLRDAHARGIIHRDIKPGNVLLRGDRVDPYVYLADFGIAQSDGVAGETGAGCGSRGSLSFLAPERHVGQPATVQSDLYGAGCVLWAMLTGTTPYAGPEFQQMLGDLNGPVPQLPGAGGDVVAVNRLFGVGVGQGSGASSGVGAGVVVGGAGGCWGVGGSDPAAPSSTVVGQWVVAGDGARSPHPRLCRRWVR